MKLTRDTAWVVAAGTLMGAAGSLLAYLGNPVNTGICISCFLENAVGAMGLHANPRMWYMRPELLGFFLGSFLMAAASREFRPRTGGAGFAGMALGALMIIGSAVFIGCPIKAFLRLAAGDMTAVAGGVGLVAGVWAGLKSLRSGDLKVDGPVRDAPPVAAYGLVAVVVLGVVLLFVPGAYLESRGGGGSIHATAWISLGAGLALGVVCQRSRFCITGSIRDVLLTKRVAQGLGLLAAIGVALILNMATGQFNPGYGDQPGAHLEWLWAFAGMGLVGWAAVIAGGCPFRQIIKSGEGDLDAASVTAGMVVGAVLVQLWGLGANVGGVPAQGKAAVLIGFAILLFMTPLARAGGKT